MESQESSTQGTALGSPLVQEETSWLDSLSEDYRSDPLIKQISSIDNLAKGYIHAQRTIGADKVVIPGKHATEEEINQFYSKLGRPESPDKYEFELGESTKVDDDFLNEFKSWAHEAGLTPQQAQVLVNKYSSFGDNIMSQQQQQTAQQTEMQMNQLKQEWGDRYDGKLQMAQVAVQELAKDDKAIAELFSDPQYGDNPAMIRLMSKVGQLFREDAVRGNGQGNLNGFSQVSEQEAKQEIEKYTGDLNGPYYDGNHPNHKQVVQKVLQLREIASSGGQSVGSF